MLTIYGGRQGRFCDGVSRREFLKIGALAMGGVGLTDVLRAEAAAGKRPGHKAVIMIFLAGGPPHQDTLDLKPDAPAEVRGPFKPIGTNVPGIQICEHLPRLAKMMDRFTIIRSLVGAGGEHSSHVCNSGFTMNETRQKHFPCLGSVVSALEGPVDRTVPPFIGLSPKMDFSLWADPGDPGFLGRAHAPLQPQGEIMHDMTLHGLSLTRLSDRRRMLAAVDRFRAAADRAAESADAINQRAFDILTSSKLAEALDVTREDPKLRARYGYGSSKNVDDGGPCWNDQFLVARRLVEAGARCVTLTFGRWDYHGANFKQCEERLPKLDQALTALVGDLHDRGLDQDVSVVVWGEMGRTPTINKDAGRDHWPQLSCALLACGGMRTGQVIGSSDRFAGAVDERPVHYKDVFATLYRNLGIDIENTPIQDPSGRPNYLLPGHSPIPELLG